METVYSDPFIFECANPIKVFKLETYQLIRNLIENRKLHVGIFKSDRLFDKLDDLKNGNEYDRFMRKQILDWFAGNRFSNLLFSNTELNNARNDRCSSAWFEDESTEEKLDHILTQMGILSIIQSEFSINAYSWLFKTSNLPTLDLTTSFNWSDYLTEIAHYTKKICIIDRYFYYNWYGSLDNILGSFLDINPDLKIEIIGDFETNSNSFLNAKEAIALMFEEFPNQISLFRLNPKTAKSFHDRFILTDYSLIKSELGFPPTPSYDKKLNKQTTPTLTGRYAADNEKWETEFFNWDNIKSQFCSKIATV